EVFNTRDGTMIVSAYFVNQWPDLCRVLEMEELTDDPRFHNNEARIQNRSALHTLLQERFLCKTSEAWKTLFESTRIIFGDVLSYSQVTALPQVHHNGSLIDLAVAEGGLQSVAAPLRI